METILQEKHKDPPVTEYCACVAHTCCGGGAHSMVHCSGAMRLMWTLTSSISGLSVVAEAIQG